MSLSKRLAAIVRMVPAGSVPADIGTDHAAVPIELVRSGICPRAFACDILAGPLSAARENIARAGLADRIGIVLSDGFGALPAGCCDTAVICGMGGQTIRHILEGRPSVQAAGAAPEGLRLKTLVLSPQSEQEELRAYLRAEGFAIEAEDLVLEDGKFYPVIRAEADAGHGPDAAVGTGAGPGTDAGADELARRVFDRFGPCLIGQAHPLLPAYLDRRERILAQIERDLTKTEGPRADAKRRETAEEREMIGIARSLWEKARNDVKED